VVIVNVGQLLIFSMTTRHTILISLGVLGNNSWLCIRYIYIVKIIRVLRLIAY
jgi:hypothetical protein